jgi:hypothetical protein
MHRSCATQFSPFRNRGHTLANSGLCSYAGCLCKVETVFAAYQRFAFERKSVLSRQKGKVLSKEGAQLLQNASNHVKQEAMKTCACLQALRAGSLVLDEMQNCQFLQDGVATAAIIRFKEDRVSKEASSGSMFSFLEEDGKVTLAGEAGFLVGEPKYWTDLKDHFEERKGDHLSIFSLGGGMGFGAARIEKYFEGEGFKVEGSKSIDTNIFPEMFSEQNRVISQDAFSFVEELPDREKGIIRIFHLGNFLSVLPIDKAVEILRKLCEKMEAGDVISILNISSMQFNQLVRDESSMISEDESNMNSLGLLAFKKGDHFFRTTISGAEDFRSFLETLGFSSISWVEQPEISLREPTGYQMKFISFLAVK